jgi:hypothetical protein
MLLKSFSSGTSTEGLSGRHAHAETTKGCACKLLVGAVTAASMDASARPGVGGGPFTRGNSGRGCWATDEVAAKPSSDHLLRRVPPRIWTSFTQSVQFSSLLGESLVGVVALGVTPGCLGPSTCGHRLAPKEGQSRPLSRSGLRVNKNRLGAPETAEIRPHPRGASRRLLDRAGMNASQPLARPVLASAPQHRRPAAAGRHGADPDARAVQNIDERARRDAPKGETGWRC